MLHYATHHLQRAQLLTSLLSSLSSGPDAHAICMHAASTICQVSPALCYAQQLLRAMDHAHVLAQNKSVMAPRGTRLAAEEWLQIVTRCSGLIIRAAERPQQAGKCIICSACFKPRVASQATGSCQMDVGLTVNSWQGVPPS